LRQFFEKIALGGAWGGGHAPPKQSVLKHCPQEAGHDAPLGFDLLIAA